MGSEQNKRTSFPPSDQPILCANGCGFFGTASNMNLCSKCYRDLRAEEAKAAAETKMKKITLTQVLQPGPAAVETKMKKITLTQVLEPAAAVLIDDKPAEIKVANRCFTCRKKVRLVGFKCRCGSTFCGEHRYPEKHECSFDYKGAGRELIAKANPIVKAEKLERC